LHCDILYVDNNKLGISILQFLAITDMKKRVLIFVCLALFFLALIPVINFNLGSKKAGYNWSKPSELYNFDFALPYISSFFYPLGISIDPAQVVIGKDGWLYLGDIYENTITSNRYGANNIDIQKIKKIEIATKSWNHWLKLNGVKLFQIMLGANKSTIYPEFLPDWGRPVAVSRTDVLLANVSQELFFDSRPVLLAAKASLLEPLYYKTDTHWNSLGAWMVFRAFTNNIDGKEIGLHWLSDQQIKFSKVQKRKGGDLANFLRMSEILEDTEVVIKITSKGPIAIEQYDFETGLLRSSGGNPRIRASETPLLVKSKNALNNKKVLWLRDSFGTALSPFMAATFTETLQIHYKKTRPLKFARLVKTFKPDYVFVTVVERNALGNWLKNSPVINP
jgi:alginate O-acetyltransferase complex protein AlgJ